MKKINQLSKKTFLSNKLYKNVIQITQALKLSKRKTLYTFYSNQNNKQVKIQF